MRNYINNSKSTYYNMSKISLTDDDITDIKLKNQKFKKIQGDKNL